MKQIISFIIVCLVTIVAFAQHNIAVTYNVTSCDNDNSEPRSYKMTLVSSPEKSLFYNKMSLYVDSCNSTPEGKAALREIQLKAWRVVQPDGSVTYDGRKLGLAPDKTKFLYVSKDFAGGTQNVYNRYGEELFFYTEPLEEIEWSIIDDSIAIVHGYECIKATSNYHGRTWEVYFTPEISIPDGPWKLHGLPGLILRAEGGDGYVMEAAEIGVTSMPVPEMYSLNDYEKGERRKLLADREHFYNNLESLLAAQGVKLNADGTPANLPKFNRQKQAWETDY